MKYLFVFSLLLTPVSGPSWAQEPASVTPATVTVDELVDILLQPTKLAEMSRAQAQQGFLAAVGADPNVARLEQSKPGLIAALASAIDGELVRNLPVTIDRLRARYREIISSRMSPDEIAQVVTFYRTPLGQRMLARATSVGAEKGVAMGREVAKSGTLRIDDAQAQSLTNEAAVAALQELKPEDMPAMVRFSATSGAMKMAGLQGDMNTAVLTEVNAMMSGMATRLGPVINETIEKHLRGAPRK